jgi:hypothetical protein
MTLKAVNPRELKVGGIFGSKNVIAVYQDAVPATWTEKVQDARVADGDQEGMKRIKFYSCESSECAKQVEIKSEQELEALVAPSYEKRYAGFSLRNAILGTSVLASCCHESSCRDAAESMLRTKIVPADTKSSTGAL